MALIDPFHIWDVILRIDELIFFKMVIAPPTSLEKSSRNTLLLFPPENLSIKWWMFT